MKKNHTILFPLLVFLLTMTSPLVVQAANLYETAIKAVGEQDFATAETRLKKWLHQNRNHIEARFLLARILSWQNKWQEALEEYDRLLAASPSQVDYLLGKSRTLLWAERPAEALPLLQRAKKQQPDNWEIWEVELQARQALTSTPQQDLQLLVSEAQKRFPEYKWQRFLPTEPRAASTAKAVVQTDWHMEGSINFSFISNDYDNWSDYFLRGRGPLGAEFGLELQLHHADRFSLSDDELLIGLRHSLTDNCEWDIEVAASPEHRVLARWWATGALQCRLSSRLLARFALQRSEYDASADLRQSGTMEYSFSSFSLAYSLTAAQQDQGDSALDHRLELTTYYRERNQLTILGSAGEKLELVAPGLTAKASTWSLGLQGRHHLTPAWFLTYLAGYGHIGSYYKRTELAIGLGFYF